MESVYQGIKFTDGDVANLDDWEMDHTLTPFLLHDHGYVLCVVFAEHLQDALDTAADKGRIDQCKVTEAEMRDYPNEEGLSFLGNFCEPYDIEGMGVLELPRVPAVSFCALFNALQKQVRP